MKNFTLIFLLVSPLVSFADIIADNSPCSFDDPQNFSPIGMYSSLIRGCLSGAQAAILLAVAVAIAVLAILFLRRRKKNVDLPR